MPKFDSKDAEDQTANSSGEVELAKTASRRKYGRLKGLGKVGPEFFELLPEEELKSWDGGS